MLDLTLETHVIYHIHIKWFNSVYLRPIMDLCCMRNSLQKRHIKEVLEVDLVQIFGGFIFY